MKSSISVKQLREFGLLIGIGFPIIFGWILPTISGHLFREWTLWVGLPFFLLSIVKPSLLFYPYKVWMKLGYILGWVNSRIILGLLFLIVLQPIALIMKVFGHDPLRKKKSNKSTYREINKDKKFDLNRIF